jgi:hypothetical protein
LNSNRFLRFATGAGVRGSRSEFFITFSISSRSTEAPAVTSETTSFAPIGETRKAHRTGLGVELLCQTKSECGPCITCAMTSSF